MARNTEISPASVTKIGLNHYTVKSSEGKEEYSIHLNPVSCSCTDFMTYKLPCKHLCAITRCSDMSWDSLGDLFNNHPLYRLDNCVVNQQLHSNDSDEPFADPTDQE
ncbi:unnamed protein product, partial [Owenia fusiformis]